MDKSALLEILEVLKVADVGDHVRTAAETNGAALHERTNSPTALRNGHRTRTLSTPAWDLTLRLPKLRTGSFFPSLLERRRRAPTPAAEPKPQARSGSPRCWTSCDQLGHLPPPAA